MHFFLVQDLPLEYCRIFKWLVIVVIKKSKKRILLVVFSSIDSRSQEHIRENWGDWWRELIISCDQLHSPCIRVTTKDFSIYNPFLSLPVLFRLNCVSLWTHSFLYVLRLFCVWMCEIIQRTNHQSPNESINSRVANRQVAELA